jgi:hypothetical protein
LQEAVASKLSSRTVASRKEADRLILILSSTLPEGNKKAGRPHVFAGVSPLAAACALIFRAKMQSLRASTGYCMRFLAFAPLLWRSFDHEIRTPATSGLQELLRID